MSSGTLDLFGGQGLVEAKDHTFQPLASPGQTQIKQGVMLGVKHLT